MNDFATRIANNIANRYWSEETNEFNILQLLNDEKLTYKDKKITLFILDMNEEQEFIKLIAPQQYVYSTDQEAVCFFNQTLDQYVIIADKQILVNANRMRFTLAHEVGHIFLGHLDQVGSAWHCRDGYTSLGTEPAEIAANKFAGELLVPMNKLGAYLSTINLGRTTFFDVAKKFSVSETVIKIRIEEYYKGLAYE